MKKIFTFAIAVALMSFGMVTAQDQPETKHYTPNYGGSWGGNSHGGGYGGNYGQYPPNYGGYYPNPGYGYPGQGPGWGNPGYGPNPGYGNPNYGNPNWGKPGWGNNANRVSNKSMNDFLRAMDDEWFDNNKVKMANFFVTNANLSAEQIGRILDQFTFDNNRVEVAKNAYNNCYDKYNYMTLRRHFTFSSNFEKVMKDIGY